jgi:hypothetical protein
VCLESNFNACHCNKLAFEVCPILKTLDVTGKLRDFYDDRPQFGIDETLRLGVSWTRDLHESQAASRPYLVAVNKSEPVSRRNTNADLDTFRSGNGADQVSNPVDKMETVDDAQPVASIDQRPDRVRRLLTDVVKFLGIGFEKSSGFGSVSPACVGIQMIRSKGIAGFKLVFD